MPPASPPAPTPYTATHLPVPIRLVEPAILAALPSTAVKVYLALLCYTDPAEPSTANATAATLAAHVGIHPRRLWPALRALEAAALVHRLPSPGTPNIYAFLSTSAPSPSANLPKVPPPAPADPFNSPEGVDKLAQFLTAFVQAGTKTSHLSSAMPLRPTTKTSYPQPQPTTKTSHPSTSPPPPPPAAPSRTPLAPPPTTFSSHLSTSTQTSSTPPTTSAFRAYLTTLSAAERQKALASFDRLRLKIAAAKHPPIAPPPAPAPSDPRSSVSPTRNLPPSPSSNGCSALDQLAPAHVTI